MARYHGVTDDTYRRLIIDAGAVYKDYGESGEVLIGATRGGNSFSVETEYREMVVDGAKGPVKGSRRITRVVAKLTANIIEFSPDVWQLMFPGSSQADYPLVSPTHTQITRALTISNDDYPVNIALVGQVSGSNDPIVCIIDNPLADSNVEVGMADNDEGVVALTFTAHFDPDDLDDEPWEIRWPDVTTED